jgi:hypothetical protein
MTIASVAQLPAATVLQPVTKITKLFYKHKLIIIYMNTPDKNTTDTQKEPQPNKQEKQDSQRVTTVTPGNENGDPGLPDEKESSNKGKGPKGENL